MATTLSDRTVIQRTVLQRNGILKALCADLVRLQPHLEAVPLKARERLQSANRRVRSIYFPESGIASLVVRGGGQRRQAEVAMLGREGMTALPVVLGTERSPMTSLCKSRAKVSASPPTIFAHLWTRPERHDAT